MYSRPARRSHARRRTFSLAVTLLVPALLAGGCTFSRNSGESTPAPPVSKATEPGRVDLRGLTVPRTAFCSVLDQGAVTEALDGPAKETAHYGNGDEVEVRPGYTDVVHEYGCSFEGADGTTAEVWVFARPVARNEARTLVRRARRGRDCTFPANPGFGKPGIASVCEVAAEGQSSTAVRARLEGLFGDSWLGCEVSEPADAASGKPKGLVRRAERWCTGVVATVGRPAG